MLVALEQDQAVLLVVLLSLAYSLVVLVVVLTLWLTLGALVEPCVVRLVVAFGPQAEAKIATASSAAARLSFLFMVHSFSRGARGASVVQVDRVLRAVQHRPLL